VCGQGSGTPYSVRASSPQTKTGEALRAEEVDEILHSYRPFVELLLERLAAGDYAYFRALLYGNDYLFRYLMRIKSQEPQVRRCSAGWDEFIVATDGRIYACEALVGQERQELGDVWQGIDPERHRPWLNLGLGGTRKVCAACWARYLCGGGCYASSLLVSRELAAPEPRSHPHHASAGIV
jgi:uncharacterized protein